MGARVQAWVGGSAASDGRRVEHIGRMPRPAVPCAGAPRPIVQLPPPCAAAYAHHRHTHTTAHRAHRAHRPRKRARAHMHTCNTHMHAACGTHVCGACGMHVRRLLLLDGHALVVVGPQPVGRDVRAAHLRVLGEDIAWLGTRRRRRGGVGQAALRRASSGGSARRQGASAAWLRPRLGPHAARARLPRAHPLGPRGSSPEQVRGRLERWVAAWAAVAARRLASRGVASRGRGVLSTLGLLARWFWISSMLSCSVMT